MLQMLGKKEVRHDKRTLKLSRYLAPHLQDRPEVSEWHSKVSDWPVYANDRIGDCAIVMVANARKSWTANDGIEVKPTEQEVIDGYSHVGGYRPGNPSTDNGCVMLDTLNAWNHDGLCGGHIRAYAQIHPGDIETTLTGCHYFGGLMIGVQLPAAVQGNTDEWLAPPDPRDQRGEWEKGSWGGHAIFGCGYDATRQRLQFVSWGKVIEMSFNFLASYVDEIYVAVSADYLGPDFTAPSGIDMGLLLSDIGAIRQVS